MSLDIIYSDETLLAGMQQDDEQSFALLFKKYWKPLYVAAGKRLGDAAEVQDIVQEVMMIVWSKRHAITTNQEGSLESYLFSLLKYGILDILAHEHKKEARARVLQQIITLQESHVLEGLVSKELDEAITGEIEEMPVNMRKVVLLSRYHQYSITEIAEKLSLSEQTVKNLLTKAVKRLRSRIEQYYHEGSNAPQAYIILLVISNVLPGL